MANSHSSLHIESLEEEATKRWYSDASKRWRLGELYQDMASAKGRGLAPVEKKHLCGLLCGYSPGEIAEQRNHMKAEHVSGALCKGLYRYTEQLIFQQTQEIAQVKRWSDVSRLLEQAGYRENPSVGNLSSQLRPRQAYQGEELIAEPGVCESWECQPDIATFYNRVDELALLKQWALGDRCRSIVLYGLAGMGKTSLAAKLAHEVKDDFKYLIWRSLRNRPSIQSLLIDILEIFGHSVQEPCLNTPSDKISQLLSYLHQHRCLLVLDDVQAVLGNGELAGQYQSGFESYGELLRRIEEETHQSCVVLTSWENPKTSSRLSGSEQPVRSCRIEGLGDEAKMILADAQLLDDHLWDDLIKPYRGNPLALRIVASSIQELFGGSVAEFIGQNTLFLGDFKRLLHQQVKRLSPLEKDVMICLMEQKKSLTVAEIQSAFTSELRNSQLMEILESLGRRSLIEKSKRKSETIFTLQPTVEKYIRTQ